MEGIKEFKVYASYKNSTTRVIKANTMMDAAKKYAIKEHKDPNEVYYLAGDGSLNNAGKYHINNWGNVFIEKM